MCSIYNDCRRVHARGKAQQAEAAARKALESAQCAREISDRFSRSPTATMSLTSNSQLGELSDNRLHFAVLTSVFDLRKAAVSGSTGQLTRTCL